MDHLPETDGCDLIGICILICDMQETDLWTVLIDDPKPPRWMHDIIDMTQSNPDRAWNTLRRYARLDNALLELDC